MNTMRKPRMPPKMSSADGKPKMPKMPSMPTMPGKKASHSPAKRRSAKGY